jgi:nucleoside-diphosphate-sugar epimerase
VEHLVKRGAQFIPGDLGDAELARRLCQGVEAVVHCAGAVGCGGVIRTSTRATWWSPRTWSKAAQTACAAPGAPVVAVDLFRWPLTPDIRRAGATALSRSLRATKYLAEQKVFGAQEFGLEVLALRPRFVTGPAMPASSRG